MFSYKYVSYKNRYVYFRLYCIDFIFAGDQWMQMTMQPPPNCPPGLEYLTQIDQLIVKQQVELLEGECDQC